MANKYLQKVAALTISFLLLFLFLSATPKVKAAITLTNPYQNHTYNYKGNLHAHSTNSDGSHTPTEVGETYRDSGYDFYAITDHNTVTADPAVSGITWMGGSEENSLDGNTAHMNLIDISTHVGSGTAQEKITNAIGQGGKVFLNHPDRSDKRWTAEVISGLTGVTGLEIYNGGGLISTGTWDTVLTGGKVIWGVAGEDYHSSRTNGYIVVNSDSPTPTKATLWDNISAGNFYASTGADLSLTTSGNMISVTTNSGEKIRWIESGGHIIKTNSAKSATYLTSGDEGYVRVEILDSSDVVKAWSQPILVGGTVTKSNVYRFWNRNGTHFYTASEAEKNNVLSRWPGTYQLEGIAYTLNQTSGKNDIPLYRLWNTRGTHFYTTSWAEVVNATTRWPNTYKYEGIAYYVSSKTYETPVYRFYNLKNGTHFYTASEAEKNTVITKYPATYKYEGVGYYIAS